LVIGNISRSDNPFLGQFIHSSKSKYKKAPHIIYNMTHAGDRLIRFLLDANFLALPGKFNVDIFEQLENFGKDHLYTLDLVVKELETLANGSGRDARHAKVGLLLMQKQGVKVVIAADDMDPTDVAILKHAKKGYYTVCTQDRELIRQLKEESIPVISLRQGRYLERV